MRLMLAIRLFFKALLDGDTASRLEQAMSGTAPTGIAGPVSKTEVNQVEKPRSPVSETPSAKPAPVKPTSRSDALTLLATLQREARLIDIVKEPLSDYSDAQIGAAARDVLQKCAAVIERIFAIEPALAQSEGSAVEVPKGYDPLRFRLTGSVSGEPPFRGSLVHAGWVATRCDLPTWSGHADSSKIVAPVEVEIS